MSNGNGRQAAGPRGRQMMVPPPRGRQMTAPQQQMTPAQQGWWWNGSNWVCDPCDDFTPPFPCPPFPGFPPAYDPASSPWYPGANAGVSFGTTAPSFPIRGNFWWDGIRLWMFDGAAWVDIVKSANTGGSSGSGSTGGSGNVIIGVNPPGNPVIGEEWWNGSQLYVWDGSTWKVVGPGALSGPVPTTTQTFSIGAPTNLTTPALGTSSAAWTVVPFNVAPTIDPALAYNGTTHQITPNKPGFYLFSARMYSGGSAGVALVRNDTGTYTGTNAPEDTTLISTTAAQGWMMTNGIVLMNGTTDFVRLWAWDSTAIFHNTGSNPVLRGYLLP
jgi:hypothetical protein